MSDHPEIRFVIQQAFRQLEADKITPWAFLSTGKMKPVKSFHDKTIQYSGVAFEGSPRLVFWQGFIQPFLEALFVWAFDMALSHSERCRTDSAEAVYIARQSLSDGIYSVFRRMQDIDRNLRGRGFPAKVPQRDVSAEISHMHAKLDLYYESSRKATERSVSMPEAPPLSDALELKPGVSGISVDLRKVWQWFRAKTGTGSPTSGCT